MVVGPLDLYSVRAVVLLDSEGKRVLAKYYPLPGTSGLAGAKEQRAFERGVWDKTRRLQAGEIIMFEGHVVTYRPIVDLLLLAVGMPDCNELMLASVMNGYAEALGILLRGQVEKRTVLENLDLAMLCLDETVDEGIILESDPTILAARVTRREPSAADIPLSEQTLSQALQTAREQLARSLLK
ncbi:Longin-like domain-containing protein [Hyaloraphidium curvatum]|nr:Longin-like domain-containing protein [Hyaloraphidium curvatum]